VVAYLRRLAGRLQLLFTTTAETPGQTTNFVRRRRKRNLEPQAEAFLRALLRDALAQALKIQPQALGLLDRFGSTLIEDATALALPASMAEQFPGDERRAVGVVCMVGVRNQHTGGAVVGERSLGRVGLPPAGGVVFQTGQAIGRLGL
jgi:hypothetical protein